MNDLLFRALSVIKDIDGVVDPVTGEVYEPIYDRASMKIEKARKMAAEGEISKGVIYYGESLLKNFGSVLPPDRRESIKRKMKQLEEMDEYGTYEENVKALNNLHKAIKKVGVVNDLMQIKKAGEICMETDPARAPKFFRAITDFMEMYAKKDPGKAFSMLDEIMPEVSQVVQEYESKSGRIYTDISR